MATRFDIQIRNGGVTITVGEGPDSTGSAGSNTDSLSGGNGKDSGTGTGGNGKDSGTGTGGNGKDSGTGTGGGESGGGCYGAPIVIGPVVISGGSLGNASGSAGGNGKDSGTGTGGNGKDSGTGSGGNGKDSGTGTGGGGTGGSGWCAPVVIGPIVINWDSTSPEASIANHGPKAVTINPPAQTKTVASKAVPFTMQTQQETYWCWAAVAVSIYDFFFPPSAVAGPSWTQTKLATALLQKLGYTSADCGSNPAGPVCNQPEALDVALKITGNLRPGGALAAEYLTFACLQSWIDAQLPAGARIVWRGGGAHFIALDGYRVTSSGRKLVHVQDPSPTAIASPGFHDYDEVVEHYEQSGYWDDTYLVIPNLP